MHTNANLTKACIPTLLEHTQLRWTHRSGDTPERRANAQSSKQGDSHPLLLTTCPDFFGSSSRWCWQLISRAYTPMSKQARLQRIQCMQPYASFSQIHPLVPFAPFLKSSVYKALHLIQICFDKVTVVVLPATH